MPHPPAILSPLRRVEFFLRQQGYPAADWVQSLLALPEEPAEPFWQALNSSRFWGGAGSIANAALMDNPGVAEVLWKQEIRAFREDLIEIADLLEARGSRHPDAQSWLLAFHNWNQSGQ